jgi:hypothetical protein
MTGTQRLEVRNVAILPMMHRSASHNESFNHKTKSAKAEKLLKGRNVLSTQ